MFFKNHQLTFVAVFFSFLNVFSQKLENTSIIIPKKLISNANAIVRKNDLVVDVLSSSEMKISVDRVVTVLNKLGNKKVSAVVGYDNNSRITKLSAKVYNLLGKKIKTFSKNKFLDISAVDGGTLYSDSRLKYLDYTPTTYPYTIHLTYQIKTSSTGFLPNWNPLEGYLVSVQQSTYTLNLPDDEKVRLKEFNLDSYAVKKEITPSKIYYEAKNIQAIKNEALSPSLEMYEPKVLLALNNFITDGVEGHYTNWEEFGKWMSTSLLKGRDFVDEVTKSKIQNLVANVKDTLERAKLVYKFMQNKTRYISVQVGIGGIQPLPASEVDKVGYGDCKGLVNYTKALLKVAGVTSYYTHVEANVGELISFDKDFASLEQGNHVILNIPYKGKDIWLECTNQDIPFGFLGNFTDDRNVLVITPDGGIIKHTPSYKNEQNLQKITAKIILDTQGGLTASIEKKSFGIQYDRVFTIENYTLEELKKYYKANVWNYNNNLRIKKVELHNDKDSVEFVEKVAVSISNYTALSQGNYLFKINVFNRNTFIPNRYRNRKLPLEILRGYKDVDSYEVKIPKGYKIQGVFQTKNIATKFGLYQLIIKKKDEKTITYHRKLLIKAGIYAKEDYKTYRNFRKSIARYDNTRIQLTKI